MPELEAYEIWAFDVKVGDVMEYRKVTEAGGSGRVVEAKVVAVEEYDDGRSVEIELEGNYAVEYDAYQGVVVYR